MRKVLFLAAGIAALGSLAACGRSGYDRARPDEFAVARQAPLVIPPDFSLVPPQPGAAPTRDAASTTQTLEALFGTNQARSPGERAALTQAGSDAADAGIRSAVGDPQTVVVDKGATTRDIVAAPEGDGQDARASTSQASTPQASTPQ
jgi:hypothetical protein